MVAHPHYSAIFIYLSDAVAVETFMKKFMEMFLAANADYNRTEPCVIRETARWAVVYKPPHLPTAPLRTDERQTLVYWFLHRAEAGATGQVDDTQGPSAEYGQCIQEMQTGNKPKIPAAGQHSREGQVCGKKAIEAGLLHRLDTDTRGLVLFAKDQAVYDFLAARQEAGQMIKTYCAFVEPCLPGAAVNRIAAVESQFRNFGPGAKKVAPVFPGSRHYKKDGRLYTTVIEAVEELRLPAEKLRQPDDMPPSSTDRPSPVDVSASAPIRVRCRLSRGYRHQVRAHLASIGLPIVGDPLYAPQRTEPAYGAENRGVSLQLYAVKLEFPDPENPRRNICVALPPPDKMNP